MGENIFVNHMYAIKIGNRPMEWVKYLAYMKNSYAKKQKDKNPTF